MADFDLRGNVKHFFQDFFTKGPSWSRIANAGNQIQDMLDSIRDRIRTVEKRISALETFAGGAAQYVRVVPFFVTANVAVALPDAPIGSVFLYVFITDGNGAWTITFPAEFVGYLSPITMEATAGVASSWMFYKHSATEFIAVMTAIENVRTS